MPDPVRRILLVCPQSTGGIGRHVQMLAGELTTRGRAVTVAAPPATLARLDLPETVGTTGLPGVRGLHRLSASYDVVHAHGVRMGALAAAARARPLVVTWHNAPIGRGPRRVAHVLLERVNAAAAAVVLGASPDLVERAAAAGGRTARMCPVVAPPLPLHDRPPRMDGVPVVLAVARLHPQKRLDLLVDAVAGWGDNRARVLVAGDGPLRDELEQRATSVGAPVTFLGARTDVAELLASADVLVLPSDWEARPLVAQEALRAGVPLLATEVGGVRELVGDAALLVRPGDVAALCAALTRLLDDEGLRARLADDGRRQAATWPDLAEMVDIVESAYADAARRGGT